MGSPGRRGDGAEDGRGKGDAGRRRGSSRKRTIEGRAQRFLIGRHLGIPEAV